MSHNPNLSHLASEKSTYIPWGYLSHRPLFLYKKKKSPIAYERVHDKSTFARLLRAKIPKSEKNRALLLISIALARRGQAPSADLSSLSTTTFYFPIRAARQPPPYCIPYRMSLAHTPPPRPPAQFHGGLRHERASE